MSHEIDVEIAQRNVQEDERRVAKQKAVVEELRRLQIQFNITFLSHARAVAKLQHLENSLAASRLELSRLTGRQK